MNIENLKIEEVIPYEKNPRKNDEAVKYVAESIKKFGFKVPIIIDKDNIIVCGHTRLKAAKKLKLKEVPCIRADDLTEEQIKAFRLADNKVSERAEWDFDLLAEELADLKDMNMQDFGFEDILEENTEQEAKEDGFEPEINEQEPAKAQLGEIYQLGKHRLMCGDSTKVEDVAKLMGGSLADLLLTDPPYNASYEGKTKDHLTIQNDNMENDAFREFLTKAFSAANKVLKPGGVYYIWHAHLEGYNFMGACLDVGWKIRQCLIWNKNTFAIGRQDYQWKHEPCLYGWKDGAGHYFIDSRKEATVFEDEKQDFKKMKKEELVELLEKIHSDKIETTIMDEKKPVSSEIHPTMRPIRLFARQIKNSSKQGEKVLDLFGGSGTTLIACEQLGRQAYLMEYDPHYVDAIIKRYEDFTGKKAIKIQ